MPGRLQGRSFWVAKGLRKGFTLLVARVKALRRAVRVDNFRLAQRLCGWGLCLSLRHLEEPLRKDVVAPGRGQRTVGLRGVGDRHHTKPQIQRIARRIIQRLDRASSEPWEVRVRPLASAQLAETGEATECGASAEGSAL